MQDTVLSLISPYLIQSNANTLWIIDENIIQIPSSFASSSIHLLTNRYDVYKEAKQKNYQAHFSDFDFSIINRSQFDLIVYRVSKERPVVHHIVNHSFHHLNTGGQLILCGHNQEGIKTHIKNAEKRFAQKASIKLDQQFRTATLIKGDAEGTTLDDKSYSSPRPITDNRGRNFLTKPGVFGWNKIDAGSEFLASHLEALFRAAKLTEGSLLDLGCGYGYLSIIANMLGEFHITATDNNAAAITVCRQNFQAHEIEGPVIANDCGMEIHQRFDGIICNPPFHSGFNSSDALTGKFIEQIYRLLKKGSSAFVVCNQFLPTEEKASALFSKIELTHRNKGFKVIMLTR